MNITLTGVSYDDAQNQIVLDGLLDGDGHRFIVSLSAIACRRIMYTIETASPWRDTITAILREHFHRLNKTAPAAGTRIERAAGMLLTGVALTVAADVRGQIDTVIDQVRADLAAELAWRRRPAPE